jgi:hypothetical protein
MSCNNGRRVLHVVVAVEAWQRIHNDPNNRFHDRPDINNIIQSVELKS